MKVKFNPFLQKASGSMGDMVFYELDGQPVARRKGEFNDKRSEAQLKHRDKVRLAAAWSRKAMADPKQKAEYKAACQGHQTPYNLGVRDFLTPPVVESIELDGYTGKAGQVLRIKAWDDFEVTQVTVVIRDAQGNLIEEGAAERTSKEGEWNYVTKTEVTSGQSVLAEATAMDRPGNRASANRWQHLAAA